MQIEVLRIESHDHVRLFVDPVSGLKALIALHDTSRGPAIGGCRFMNYHDFEHALEDVLRLSAAMSLKTIMADLPFGGGKAVIIGNPEIADRKRLMRAFGCAVSSFEGRYLTGEDVGTTPADMDQASIESAFVLGRSDGAGHLQALLTAMGTRIGISVALEHRTGDDSLLGRHIAIQGLGQTGMALARILSAEGAVISAHDIDDQRCILARDTLGATIVDANELHSLRTDVLAPCALGNVITHDNVGRINAKVIAGCANNQLADPVLGSALASRNILYAPDFVINAGGVINAAHEAMPGGYDRVSASRHLQVIAKRLNQVFALAVGRSVSTQKIAHAMATALIENRKLAA